MKKILLRVSVFCVSFAFASVCFGQHLEPHLGQRATVGVFHNYAVAAGDTQASQAGAQVLERGGSAADAAAAAMLALGVSSPMSSGLGGGGFALYYRASDKSITFLDFRERAPQKVTPMLFSEGFRASKKWFKPADDASEVGGLSVAVLGEPAGIAELLKRFGKLERKDVVAPALRLAKNGFLVSEYFAQIAKLYTEDLQNDVVSRSWFAKNGSLMAGSTVTNPALAQTLELFANEGAAPFYRGDLAKEIVRRVYERGGMLSLEDLANYQVVERAPLRQTSFGFEWVTAPPPSAGGYTLLASLTLLEKWLGKAPTIQTLQAPGFYHALTESWKGPFLDRQTYFGDPDYVALPLTALQNPLRVQKRAAHFLMTKAQPSSLYAEPLPLQSSATLQPTSGGTSHICVVDGEGNVAAVTTTVNLPFGARFSAAGFWMNDEMDDFAKAPGKKNAFGLPGGALNLPGKGKRPVSTMTPAMVFKQGKPVLCIGGVGGSRIVTAVEQVALQILLGKQTPLEAVAQPRIHHQANPDVLEHENVDPKILSALKKQGHSLTHTDMSAKVEVIHINASSHQLSAASDPRKGALPAGR